MEQMTAETVAGRLAAYLAILAALVPLVWAAAEALGGFLGPGWKRSVAAVLGPLMAVLALLFGWLPVWDTLLPAAWDWLPNVVFALIVGFGSTLGAKALNIPLDKAGVKFRPKGG